MHEYSLAMELIQQILDIAKANDAYRVEKVELECGGMQLVVPEALATAFDAVCVGTIAEGATLEIVEVPIEAKCRQCGHAFAPEVDCFLCPACSQADVHILKGNDLILKSVVCECE